MRVHAKNFFYLLQFMNRPQDLHLLPDETYPTDRLVTEKIKKDPLIMKNMTQMADFTFKLYIQKVESMKEAMVCSLTMRYRKIIYVNSTFNQESFKDVYEKIPTEDDVEMTEEPAVTVISNKRENKNEKKEFVATTIRNEIDIDVSMLERKEMEKPTEDKEMTEE